MFNEKESIIVPKRIVVNGRKNLMKWDTRDLLVTAVIGVAFGLISIGPIWLFLTLGWLTGPVGSRVIIGIFFTVGLIVPYIIRRPGAAIMGQFFSALVQVPLSPYGWMVLVMVITNGLPCELMFLSTRYKKYTISFMMLAGAVVAIPGYFIHAHAFGYFSLSNIVIVGALLVQILSGALLGGWLAKFLADSIAKTGVLSNYILGQEIQEEI